MAQDDTQLDTRHQEQNHKKKKTPWHMRIYLLLAGLIIASGIKLILNFAFQGPMPPSEYPNLGGDFTLQSEAGPTSLHDYKNKVVVLFFGYTQCPDICPTTLSNMAAALRLLKGIGELDKVESLFITLDPEKDTVERVSNFTHFFHNKIRGLTGTQNEIAHVADLFKVGFEKVEQKDSALGYSINHASHIYIIRPDGSVGDLLSHSSTPKNIVQSIRPWLDWAEGS